MKSLGYEVTVRHPGNRVITYENVRHMQLTPSALYIRGLNADGSTYTICNDELIVSIEIKEEADHGIQNHCRGGL